MKKGTHHTEESKAKMRAAQIDKQLSPEHVARIKASRQNVSDETRAKMSKASKGKPKSAAHRAAMSKAHMGKKHTLEHVESIRKAKTGMKYKK